MIRPVANVMISYSRRNRDAALRVDEALQAAGKEVWIDREIEPAADWWERITKAIDECSSVVFLLSPDSLDSDVCTKEVDYALKDGKRIIPVVVVDPGDTRVPPALAARNYVWLRDEDDWDDGIRKIVAAIDTDLEWADYHGQVLLRALAWDEADRPNDALLRGSELSEAEQRFARPRTVVQSQPTTLQLQYLQAGRAMAGKRLRRFIAIGGVATAAIAVLAVVALFLRSQAASERDRANDEAEISRSGELAARSIAATDGYEAAVLAIEADQGRSTAVSRSALTAAATRLDELPANRKYPRLLGHDDFVWHVDVSVTAGRIVSVGRDGLVRAWDLDSGTPVDATHQLAGFPTAVEFSPDGALVAVVDTTRQLTVLTTSDLAPVAPPAELDHAGTSARWLDGSDTLAVTSTDLLTTFWNVDSWELEFVDDYVAVDQQIWAVDLSPDGRWVAGGTIGGETVVWDVATGEITSGPTPTHDQAIYSVEWSPDSSQFASTSLDRTIVLTDATGESILGDLFGHEEGVLWSEWSPDGRRLVSTGFDGSVRVWDTVTMSQQGAALPAHRNSTSVVAWAADGDVIASASDDLSVMVWDVEPPDGESTTGDTSIRSVAWDDASFWIAADDGSITLTTANGTVETQTWPTDDPLVALEVSPDGGRIAALDQAGRLFTADRDGVALETAQLGSDVEDELLDGVRPGAVDWSPDGSVIAATLDDGVWIWRPGDDPRLLEVPTAGWMFALAWSPDGSALAAGGTDDLVHVWNVADDTAVVAPLVHHIDDVYDLEWSPDGATLASASKDKTVRLWSTDDWEPVGPDLVGHRGWILDVEWSPDGAHLATSSPDRTIRFWDAETGSAIGVPLGGFTEFVSTIAWHESGERLVAGDRSGRFAVYETVSESALCTRATNGLSADEVAAIDVGASVRTCTADVTPEDSVALPAARVVSG